MNFAFSALVIFVLLLPGVVLNYTYSRGFWTSSPVSIQNYTDQIAQALIGAIVLHFLWGGILAQLGYTFDLASILRLLLNSYGKDDQFFEQTIQSVTCCPNQIVLYIVSSTTLAALLGYAGHWIVRSLKLDRKIDFLRFNNDWYYLLSGEVLEFGDLKNFQDPPPQIDGVFFSAVVQLGERDYLFRGIVADFSYDHTGQLDKIVLRFAHRRALGKDREPGQPRDPADLMYERDGRYYPIRGDFFVLKYKDIKTANVEYITILTEEEAEATNFDLELDDTGDMRAPDEPSEELIDPSPLNKPPQPDSSGNGGG